MELVLQKVINCGQTRKLDEKGTLEARVTAKRIGILWWPGKADTWMYEA
jgi:hypothetical protein